MTGTEQESLCIRYVDENLEISEKFIGLHEMTSTKGEDLANMILDVLKHLDLPLQNLRGQTYDGASNMSGQYNGCQAKIKDKQPLATYFHCNSHLANLVLQHAVNDNPTIRDAIQWVHELGFTVQEIREIQGSALYNLSLEVNVLLFG